MKIHNMTQGSEAWFTIRRGLPTGARFKDIITSTGAPSKSRTAYAHELAAEMYAGTSISSWGGHTSVAMTRGSTVEADAVSRYCFERDVDSEPVGFITNDDGTYGASPDALILPDGAVEVKAPNAQRMMEYVTRWTKEGTIDPSFIAQTQGEMFVSDGTIKWVDLIFFHPALPLLVCRQHPSPAIFEALRAGIAWVIRERDAMLAILRRQAEMGDAFEAPAPIRPDDTITIDGLDAEQLATGAALDVMTSNLVRKKT